jgi:hypothetical protein
MKRLPRFGDPTVSSIAKARSRVAGGTPVPDSNKAAKPRVWTADEVDLHRRLQAYRARQRGGPSNLSEPFNEADPAVVAVVDEVVAEAEEADAVVDEVVEEADEAIEEEAIVDNGGNNVVWPVSGVDIYVDHLYHEIISD